MPEQSGDQPSRSQQYQEHSRFQEYQERMEHLMIAAREGFERRRPEILEKAAATARVVAGRLDNMARDARRDRAEQEAESAGTSEVAPEPPDQPPAPPGESRNASA
jgi:hypothetical protein